MIATGTLTQPTITPPQSPAPRKPREVEPPEIVAAWAAYSVNRRSRPDLLGKLAEYYLPFAAMIADSCLPYRDPGFDRSSDDDFRSEAAMALLRAIRKFEPDRGVPFKGYANRVIRNAICDLARKRARHGAVWHPIGGDDNGDTIAPQRDPASSFQFFNDVAAGHLEFAPALLLFLVGLRQFSVSAASRLTGISEKTCRRYLREARGTLSETLDRRELAEEIEQERRDRDPAISRRAGWLPGDGE